MAFPPIDDTKQKKQVKQTTNTDDILSAFGNSIGVKQPEITPTNSQPKQNGITKPTNNTDDILNAFGNSVKKKGGSEESNIGGGQYSLTQSQLEEETKPETKQDVQRATSHLTTKYFADIIPDAVKSGIDPRKLVEGVSNGNAEYLKIMRDQITSLLNKKIININQASYQNTFSGVPLMAPVALEAGVKTPEQQQDLSSINKDLKDVQDYFNKYIGYALTDKYKKISGGNISSIDYKDLGSEYNAMTNDVNLTKKQKLATESNLPEGKAVLENLDYGNTQTGLQLAIGDLKSSFEQDIQDALKDKNPDKLLSAKVKSDQYNDLFNKYNNLLDQYPSVAKNYVARLLGDKISENNPAFNLYVSKDDITKAAQQIEQTNPGFINKYGKYVDELKGATGGFFGDTSPIPAQGLTGALNRGMKELDLTHWFSSEENRAARELSLQESAFGHGTSYSGRTPTKIILDGKGTSFIEKENETGNGLFNNAMRVIGEGIPGLAEWTIAEELTGGLAGALIGDIKAARYTKALTEVKGGSSLSKVAGLEGIETSQALKRTIGLYGAQYLVSYDHNYDFANEIVPGDTLEDEFKKKVIANIVTIGQGTAFKLLDISPSSIMGKSFANNLTKDAYQFLEKNAGKIDQESLYKFYQNSVIPKAKAIVESLGETGKFGGVSVLNQALQDVTGNIFSDKYKGANAQDYTKIFTESALLGFVVNMLPKISRGISPTNKDALGIAGVFNEELSQQINENVRAGIIDQNQANKMIQIANTMHESIAESSDLINRSGLPLTTKQLQDISVLKFRKKYLEEANKENPNSESEAVISEIDKSIENILGQNAYHQVDNSHFVNSMDIRDVDGVQIFSLKELNPNEKFTFKNEDGITETMKGAKIINYIHDNFKPDEKTVSAQQERVTSLEEKPFNEHGFDEEGNIIKKKEGEQLTPEEQIHLESLKQNILSFQKSKENEKRNENDQSKDTDNEAEKGINAKNENEGQKDVLIQQEGTTKESHVPSIEKFTHEQEKFVQKFVVDNDANTKISSVVDKINNADYINEKELNAASDILYDLWDKVNNQSLRNLIEPLINKIEGYEFKTKTETITVTEEGAIKSVGTDVRSKGEVSKALNQWEGNRAKITTSNGNTVEGILKSENGRYFLFDNEGQKISSLGEKSITDRDVSLPSKEDVPMPIQIDENGDIKSITLQLNKVDKESGGIKPDKLITIEFKDKEKALDYAIQLRAEQVGEFSEPQFEKIVKEVQQEIPVNEKEKTKILAEQRYEGSDKGNESIEASQERKDESRVSEVHEAAKQANIDIESKDFMDKSEELTGKRHLDDMSSNELGKMVDYIKSQKTEENASVQSSEQKQKSSSESSKQEYARTEISEQESGKAKNTKTDGGDSFFGSGGKQEKEKITPEGVGITHEQTEQVREEYGLPTYDKSAETVAEWDAKADVRIKDGEMPELIRKLERGDIPSEVEQRMMGKYMAFLDAKASETKSNEDITKLHQFIELSDRVGGSMWGRAGVARKGIFINDETLGAAFIREMETERVSTLTEQQKQKVQKEWEDLRNKNEQLEKDNEALRAANSKFEAEQKFKEEQKKTQRKKSSTVSKKTHEDFVKERQDAVAAAREALKKIRTGESGITVRIPVLNELIAIAPHVTKALGSLLEEGVIKLSDAVKELHNEFKDVLDGLTEKHIHDIIAGKYNERKQTLSELTARKKDLVDEAKLINKLKSLEEGGEPKEENKKIERNKQIKELQEQIKGGSDLQAMARRNETQTKKIQEAIDKGNYEKPEKKTPALEDKQLRERFPALYKKAVASKDALIKTRQDREIRLLKQEYANRTNAEKIRDYALEVLNIPRTIMASMDFSAPLRQGIIPSIAHPKEAAKAFVEMFRQAASQKRFDRWFYDLRKMADFQIMEKSGLYVADPHDPKLSAKEEAFMNNMAEKIPLFGKFIKGSERAYVSFLNKMRVDLFKKGEDVLSSQGKTIENAKPDYEALASWVNNSTGRGKLGALEAAAPVLNSVLFSPRLMASRINLLNPMYYAKLPKSVRIMALKDMAKFIGFGMTVLGLAKLNGAEVETDPRSSDFGKIKIGATRYDIWGGFQQYIRVISQIFSGETKSTKTGNIYTLSGEGPFGRTRADVGVAFVRGKTSPVISTIWDFAAGRTASGEPVTVPGELESHLLPLIYSDVKDAYKEQGVKSLFTVGLPATFGIGVQTYK